jgi:hypothetical protein
MHGDADGQQLDQGTLRIILVSQVQHDEEIGAVILAVCRQRGHVTSTPATVQPALRDPGAAPQMALIHGWPPTGSA